MAITREFPWQYQGICFGKTRDFYLTEYKYLDELKSVACCYGFSPESVDRLLESGFSTDDIEEFLYEGAMY